MATEAVLPNPAFEVDAVQRFALHRAAQRERYSAESLCHAR